MKLVSMTEFVLEQDKLIRRNEITPYHFTMNVTDYALFLKRPLTLDMFVPCDDKGNVLDEPLTGVYGNEQYERCDWDEYMWATKKVMFKGLEFEQNAGKEKSYFNIIKSTYPTVESLVDFEDVELTAYAIKNLGL